MSGKFCAPLHLHAPLPAELKLMRSTPVFKSSLKTFLFQTAYCSHSSGIALFNWKV